MSPTEYPTFRNTRLITVPHASIRVGSASVLAWADSGQPTVLDAASAAMLEAFAEPLSPGELATDLEVVLGLDGDVAKRSAASTARALRDSGLVIPEGEQQAASWNYHYPPDATT
jgi:hypothetical protein